VDERDIERLARPEARARLPFRRLLWLYLDPFALLKELTGQPDALHYNRRQRRILLPYARRWAVIAMACMAVIACVDGFARGYPLLWIPLAALEIGFATGLCLSFVALAAYIVLGLERL
jgi:hypothetical protein